MLGYSMHGLSRADASLSGTLGRMCLGCSSKDLFCRSWLVSFYLPALGGGCRDLSKRPSMAPLSWSPCAAAGRLQKKRAMRGEQHCLLPSPPASTSLTWWEADGWAEGPMQQQVKALLARPRNTSFLHHLVCLVGGGYRIAPGTPPRPML